MGFPPLPMLKFNVTSLETQNKIKETFFAETTKRGILLHPNHHWFLSLAHTDTDVDRTLEAVSESIKIAKKL